MIPEHIETSLNNLPGIKLRLNGNTFKGDNPIKMLSPISYGVSHNPMALRKAKIVYNFGLSECNRINRMHSLRSSFLPPFHEGFCLLGRNQMSQKLTP